MNKKSINKTALLTVLIATLSSVKSVQAASQVPSINNQTAQQHLQQKIDIQSDIKLQQFMTTMTQKMDKKITQSIIKELKH